MTRTPKAHEPVVNGNECLLVGGDQSVVGLTNGMLAGSNDLGKLRDLQTLAKQLADKCQRLLPPLTANEDQNNDERFVEQAAQTENDLIGERFISIERHVAEIDQLNKKFKQVVDMNVGWQLVHEQQEKLIIELKTRLHQLQLQPTAPTPHHHHRSEDEIAEQRNTPLSAGQQRHDDDTCHKCIQLQRDKSELEDTVRCMTSQLESMQELMRQLELTVDQQQNQLDDVTREKQSFIDTLQAQIMVYREDFQCERQDRERAQGKIVELKMELELLKNRLLAEQSAMRHSIRPSEAESRAFNQHPPVVPYGNHHNDHHRHRYVTGLPPTATPAYYPAAEAHPFPRREQWFYRQVGGGLDEADCTADANDVTEASVSSRRNVCVDGGMVTSDGPELAHESSATASEVLKCPSCHKSFSVDQHVDLMDHMDACSAA